MQDGTAGLLAPGLITSNWPQLFQFLLCCVFFSCERKISVKHRDWADFSLLPVTHLLRGCCC